MNVVYVYEELMYDLHSRLFYSRRLLITVKARRHCVLYTRHHLLAVLNGNMRGVTLIHIFFSQENGNLVLEQHFVELDAKKRRHRDLCDCVKYLP